MMLELLIELRFTDFLTVNEHFQVVICCRKARKSFIQRVWWQTHRLPFVHPEEYKHVRKLRLVHDDEPCISLFTQDSFQKAALEAGFTAIYFENTRHLIADGQIGSSMLKFQASLHSLSFVGCSTLTLQCQLPPKLQSLVFNDNFDEVVVLPPLLTSLVLGAKCAQDIHFPSTLFHLELGLQFPAILVASKLPASLQTLTMQCFFNQKVDPLPVNLQQLTLLNTCYIGGPICVPQVYFEEEFFQLLVDVERFVSVHHKQVVHIFDNSLSQFQKHAKDVDWVHLSKVLKSMVITKHNYL
jgi:hypothetical protein